MARSLKANVSKVEAIQGTVYLCIGTAALGTDLGKTSWSDSATGIRTVDISNINVNGYINVQVQSGSSYADKVDISFNKVWLE